MAWRVASQKGRTLQQYAGRGANVPGSIDRVVALPPGRIRALAGSLTAATGAAWQ